MCHLFLYFIFVFFFLMIRRPPRSTRTDTLFPYTTLFRSERSALTEAMIAAGVSMGLPLRSDPNAPDGGEGIGYAARNIRSEEHTSELQSLMRISYAVFCLKKKKNI